MTSLCIFDNFWLLTDFWLNVVCGNPYVLNWECLLQTGFGFALFWPRTTARQRSGAALASYVGPAECVWLSLSTLSLDQVWMSDRATNCLICLELSFLGYVTYSVKTGIVLGKLGSWTNMYLQLHFPDNSDCLMGIYLYVVRLPWRYLILFCKSSKNCVIIYPRCSYIVVDRPCRASWKCNL